VNGVAHRERSKSARHEAAHASAALLLGVVPDEIHIAPAPATGGYTQGECFTTAKASINALVLAVGVKDQHGIRGPNGESDVYELERLVPDAAQRAEILEAADRVMRHPEFVRVRNALWRRLQFTDVMHHEEIAKIATAAAGLQVSR
jgi:hypothetical protein